MNESLADNLIRIDCDGRDFLVNKKEIICIVPNENIDESNESPDDEYVIVFKSGDKYLISYKEYLKITED